MLPRSKGQSCQCALCFAFVESDSVASGQTLPPLLAFATHVQRDLGPFFTAWGWPLSAQALTTMAALPAWTGDPMN